MAKKTAPITLPHARFHYIASVIFTCLFAVTYLTLLLPFAQRTLQPTAAAAPTISQVPACTPTSASTPDELGLDGRPMGLSTAQAPTAFYTIHGVTATDIRNQIIRCAPREGDSTAKFTGETSYRLNWQYNITSDGSKCYLSDVRVGLNTQINMPDWQTDPAASARLRSEWQRFTTALMSHEQGHISLDRLYAASFTADLEQLRTSDCAAMNAAVQSLVARDTAKLNNANTAYDAHTNHGATQGAVLPAN